MLPSPCARGPGSRIWCCRTRGRPSKALRSSSGSCCRSTALMGVMAKDLTASASRRSASRSAAYLVQTYSFLLPAWIGAVLMSLSTIVVAINAQTLRRLSLR